jgi:hypothetical protein
MIPKELLPRPALRIGVTGRRTLSVRARSNGAAAEAPLDVTEKMRKLVGDVLAKIQETAKDEFIKARHFYQDEPPVFRAVSPIAEGADRLFAEEALKLGYRLECALPFQRDEYARDFTLPGSREKFFDLLGHAGDSVLELDGQRAPKTAESAAYENVGRLVVDQCDLLIVIWDGKTDSGAGGTSAIMQFASGRVPVVCLRMDDEPHTIYRDRERSRPEPYSHAALRHVIEHTIAPPRVPLGRKEDSDITGDYIQSLTTKGSLLGWIWRRFIWAMLVGRNARRPSSPHVPDGPFKSHFDRFDGYANRLTGLYRGAFLLNYTLGVLAVMLALFGFASRLQFVGHEFPHWVEDAFLVVEGLTIGAIIVVLWMLRRRRWHYRSVDCRYLGEQFRVMCYVYPLGIAPPRARFPAHHVQHDVQKSWMDWLLRGIIRQTPMNHGVFSREESNSQRGKILAWVRGQVQYHKQNAHRLELIDGRLRRIMWASLIVILLACLGHFFLPESTLDDFFKPLDLLVSKDKIVKTLEDLQANILKAWWLTALAAGLPALSSACHAIATQGEFERLAERSKAMCSSLEVLAAELREMGASGNFTVGDLREEARNVSELVVEEVVDWQILYRKPVPPP